MAIFQHPALVLPLQTWALAPRTVAPVPAPRRQAGAAQASARLLQLCAGLGALTTWLPTHRHSSTEQGSASHAASLERKDLTLEE